nr:GH25 family lysozyme [Ligilactobacillus ruminis]
MTKKRVQSTNRHTKLAVSLITFLSAGCLMTIPANAETVQPNAVPSGRDVEIDSQGKVTDFANEYTEVKAPFLNVMRSSDTCDVFGIGDGRYTHGDAIDVASYQSGLTLNDYKQLKAKGIKTVIVKVSQGRGYLNPAASNQIRNAIQAGLKVAVYHYATFNNSGSGWNEGNHMADCLRKLGLGPNTLIFADMEDRATLNNQVKNGLNSFWRTLNNAGYRNHAVYVYAGYKYRDAVVSTVGKSRTWLAQYPFTPSRGGYYERQWRNQGYGAWQFASTSRMPWKWWFGNLDLSTDFNGLLTNAPSTSVSNGWFGNKYYVNGNAVTGQRQINGKWYLFGSDGSMKTGLQWVADQNKTCYYASNGQMQYGQQCINGKWYLFDKNTGAMKTGLQWIEDQKKTCYYASNGQMQYGQQCINGKWYLFDKNTGAMKTGLQWVADQNKTCYYASNGQMQYGSQKIGNYYCYFDPSTGSMHHGWLTLNGKKYYYDKNGHKVFGEQTIDGSKCLFDKNTGELKSQSKPNVIVKPVASSGWKTVNGKTFYYSKGKAVTGQQHIGGKWYLFDKNTGAMKTGFQWISDQRKTCYYNGNGQMQYGQQHIGGKWYLFDKNTGAMKTGFQWISDQRKTCYYNGEGQMQYGQQHIGGKWYLFDKNTGAMKTGFQWISDQRKTCYYNGEGQMQYGQQHIGGKWYLFDKNTGAMKTGFQWISDQRKTCYYNGNGQMQYGQQHIGGKWYLFDKNTGAMKTGFQWISDQHKTCYYNGNGQMLYGRQYINGRWYTFNRWTGALMN